MTVFSYYTVKLRDKACVQDRHSCSFFGTRKSLFLFFLFFFFCSFYTSISVMACTCNQVLLHSQRIHRNAFIDSFKSQGRHFFYKYALHYSPATLFFLLHHAHTVVGDIFCSPSHLAVTSVREVTAFAALLPLRKRHDCTLYSFRLRAFPKRQVEAVPAAGSSSPVITGVFSYSAHTHT